MTTIALTPGQNVNLALTARFVPGMKRMVNQARDAASSSTAKEWIPGVTSVLTLIFMMATILFGSGGFFNDTKGGIARLEEQQKNMQVRLDQIVNRIDSGPRADQMQEIVRTNAAQDGRIDGMRDAWETRMRALELEVRELTVQMKSMQAATDKKLPGDRR